MAKIDDYRIDSDQPDIDLRRKVTNAQYEDIRNLYKAGGISQSKLGLKFGISKRAIQFILDPEKLKDNRSLRDESRTKHYNRNHTEAMRRHRKHKKELFKIPAKIGERNDDTH